MDAVDPDRFARITRVPDGYDNVLAGIRASRRAGLWPVKVNCVLMRGFNEDQIIPFGMFAREEGVVVRFIEFMPLEEDRVWSPNTVVTLDEILRRMAEYRPLVEIPHAPQRDRAPLPLRRWHRRNRHHRARLASLLRTLQPHPHHLRRQNSHLPVFRLGPRSARPDAPRRSATTNWRNSFAASSRKKKPATTSASRISCPRRGPWSTSAASPRGGMRLICSALGLRYQPAAFLS